MHVTTTLSPEQAKFALWVSEQMPHLEHLFDWDEKGYKPEAVDAYLSTASHSEIIMAKFVLGVWRNTNQFDFDLVEAAKTLDAHNRSIIVNWLNAPFFP